MNARWMPEALREETLEWLDNLLREETDDRLADMVKVKIGCDLDNKIRAVRNLMIEVDKVVQFGACCYCGAPCEGFDNGCRTAGCRGRERA